jgi:ubiquinone/menaquinone biosynthesis C-methylase UbiE
MDHYQKIYAEKASEYHHMMSAEDVDGNLMSALERVTSFKGKTILDLGTGTGRLPLLLSDQNTRLIGIDLYRAMLIENQNQREKISGVWDLVQGDMRKLPLPTRWAQVVFAGWAIGHLRDWFSMSWQTHIGRILDEIHRVVAPGGYLLVVETLGTGSLVPTPPTEGLSEYYAWLENEWDFSRQEIPTDYIFPNVDSAVNHTEFFFGEELAEKIRRNNWTRLPEWTGVWSKQVANGG